MTTRNSFMLLPLSALLLLLGAGAPGCGGGATVDAVCAKCNATGSTLDMCISQGNNLQVASEKAGCEDQFQAYVDCADEKGTCEGDLVAADKTCKVEFDALEACGVNF